MGDICTICEGPHATRHHGADFPPEPPGPVSLIRCNRCFEEHPPNVQCPDHECPRCGGEGTPYPSDPTLCMIACGTCKGSGRLLGYEEP